MTSDFAPEIAKYPKSNPNPQIAQDSLRAYCLVPLAMQLVKAEANAKATEMCPAGLLRPWPDWSVQTLRTATTGACHLCGIKHVTVTVTGRSYSERSKG